MLKCVLVLLLLQIVLVALHNSTSYVEQGEECKVTNQSRTVYYRLSQKCPLRLHEDSFYYTQQVQRPLKVSHYYDPNLNLSHLHCPGVCGGMEQPTTVIKDLPILYEKVLSKLIPNTADMGQQVPWCQFGSGSGYWVARELWSQVDSGNEFDVTAKGENAFDREKFPASVRGLSRVMSGDLAVALTWPFLWVPTNCRMHRYNVSTFLKCAAKWKERTNTTLWIYFMGDSTTEGIFCGFLRMLTAGGECQGAFRKFPCRQGTPLGTTIPRLRFTHHVQLTYVCAVQNFLISFYFTHNAGFPLFGKMIPGMMATSFSSLGYEAKHPTHVVYNSGEWDHTVRVTTKEVVEGGKKGGKSNKRKVRTVLNFNIPTAANPIDHAMVNAQRPGQVKAVWDALRRYGFDGQFIYRSNLCSTDVDARAADVAVEALVQQDHQGRVMNLYNASICRGTDLLRDHIHIDRHFARRPPKAKPSLGELNMLVVHSLLNGICNPLL